MQKLIAPFTALAALFWAGGVIVQEAAAGWHIPNPPRGIEVMAAGSSLEIDGSIDIPTDKAVDCSGIAVWASDAKAVVAKTQAMNSDGGCSFWIMLPADTRVSLYAMVDLSWLANNGLTEESTINAHKPEFLCDGKPCTVKPDGLIVLMGKVQVNGLNLELKAE